MTQKELLYLLRPVFPRMVERDLIKNPKTLMVEFCIPGTAEVSDSQSQDSIDFSVLIKLTEIFETQQIRLKFGAFHVRCQILDKHLMDYSK